MYAAVVLASLPLYGDRWHLLLHILGAVVFVGNIVVSCVWMLLAERTGQTSVLRFASRTVSHADLLFTGPGVILVLGNGLALASSRWGGWTGFYVHSWIVVALGLFAASGLVWVGFLLRYQFKLVGLSAAARRVRSRADRRVLPRAAQVVGMGQRGNPSTSAVSVPDGDEAGVVVRLLLRAGSQQRQRRDAKSHINRAGTLTRRRLTGSAASRSPS